jgi:hypothetical protein
MNAENPVQVDVFGVCATRTKYTRLAELNQADIAAPESGRPGESRPRAPTERSVNLSVHSALLI